MKRSIFAFVFAVTLSLFASQSFARGCGDCGFPMAKLYGKWESGNTELILQQRSRNGNTVVVDVAIIDSSSRKILARGHGVGNVNNTDLRVQLMYSNGVRKVFMLSVNNESHLRINLGSTPRPDGNCNDIIECIDFTQSVPGKFFDDESVFDENPDQIDENDFDY